MSAQGASVAVEVDSTEGAGSAAESRMGGGRWLIALFATTSFVGASLLFVIQPMVARLVLPQFGGSATVWSTSNLFFQVILLVGYIYAHAATRSLGPRFQPLLHVGLLLLPIAALPIALAPALFAADVSPVARLLVILTLTVGLPFAVVSTTGPLLQRWYSWTSSHRSDDPYFLFAAGNLGSFAGLLAYPFVVEPLLTLDQQRMGWSVGYGIFLVLMAACGIVAFSRHRDAADSQTSPAASTGSSARIPIREILIWLALAFIPSSLMLGVTSHISTDVAAVPLMWVVPLAIYLATFVVAFARTTRVVPQVWVRASGMLAIVALAMSLTAGAFPVWSVIAVDLSVLTVAAFASHALLAARRPRTEQLTLYFIVVAVGGAMGGLLNGLIAPLVFRAVWEYPLVLVGVVLLALPVARSAVAVLSRRYHPGFVLFLESMGLFAALMLTQLLVPQTGGQPVWFVAAVVSWLVLGFLASRRPISAAIAGLALFLVPTLMISGVIVRDRSFYGAYSVREAEGWRSFSHGTTLHGKQALDARASEPSTYYARSGPVGDIMEAGSYASVGAVGLGVGTVAAYGERGMQLTFYEIDQDVIDIASDPALFTYVSNSRADVKFVVGDGRLSLEDQPNDVHDLLILDAFTSDAIPVHLLTAEAFGQYARVLDEDGILLVHISSRVFDLEPVVAAGAASVGWYGALGIGEPDEVSGATASEWIALSPDAEGLTRILDKQNWRPLEERQVRWTDNYSSIITVLRGS